ncbi:MAG: acyl-CoA dehydratase activase-related protein [Patescibacteria group bacterium]|nr:acyl-CoA dehydratase activase-related protein [Patescibacteria group bacterium]
MTIGIPQGLIHFKEPYFWKIFFNNLGFKTVLSPLTNKQIVSLGIKVADPETCFSNKVYWGHLMWLDTKCDFIFVPRLKTNKEKLEYCPKFFALPDLAKMIVKTPILTEVFDEKKQRFIRSLKKLGAKLNKSSRETKQAYELSLLEVKELKDKEKQSFLNKISSKKPKIVLVSHPYNLFDSYVNLRVEEKLKKLGIEPIFIDEVSQDMSDKTKIDRNNKDSFKIDFHWEFGKEIIDKINETFKYNIVGAIQISSFQCGCDAVLKEFVEEEFRSKKIPFLYIIVDEHTGEAGLQTRLEAFIDTL